MSEQKVSDVTYKRNPLLGEEFHFPVLLDRGQYYRAIQGEAEAVFTIHDGELRIPYIQSGQRGHMAWLMDTLVDDLGYSDVRFVNLAPEGMVQEVLQRVAEELGQEPPENDRDIRDAVHGFEEEIEHWEGTPAGVLSSFEEEECICLVGTWGQQDG